MGVLMEKEITYYDLAADDYNFLKECIAAGIYRNAMASIGQEACEKYLKHVIDVFIKRCDELIINTHSLHVILAFIRMSLPDLDINQDLVLKADGFYYNTNYPGKDSFMADIEDICHCMEALEETKRAVDEYLGKHEKPDKGISLSTLNLFKK